MEEIVKQIIKETCSHWLLHDEKELQEISKTLTRKLTSLKCKNNNYLVKGFCR